MAFTPSNIYLANVGSLNLTIAKINTTVTSGTNNWNSGITDIVAIGSQVEAPWLGQSSANIAVSYTASSGTVWLVNNTNNSGSPLTLFVYSGLVVKGT